LSPSELLDTSRVLSIAARMAAYRPKPDEEDVLSVYFDTLEPNRFLERAITDAIIAEDIIADQASPELFSVRRSIKKAENSIRDALSKYTGGTQNKYLQENIVTMRNGRYVVPVKSEYRNEVKGLLHDTSASGATLFIEPLAVLEANNKLRELRSREQEEIEKILRELSEKVAGFSVQLVNDYNALTELDVIFAKSEFSYRCNGIAPVLTEFRDEYSLIAARHPLLDKEKTVPITLSSDKKISTVVITGPNTGGKTVTLKTLGLFSLMAQCGIHLPCSCGTVLPVFDAVLPDIGDEQSIEQSLSTFSAHIKNIVDIIGCADFQSLVLFDELGAGTDPVEGAALAISILEKIRALGAFCAATTHYAEIKVYALENDSILNASCEFDIDTLKPTYRLITGIPGRSNAFAIAQRLGISEEIIEKAKAYMDDDNSRFEDVIGKLQRAEQTMREEQENAKNARIEAQNRIHKVQAECDELIAKANAESQRVKAQADKIIADARVTSEYVMTQLENAKKERDRQESAQALEEARRNIRTAFKNTSTSLEDADIEDDDYVLPRELRKGDRVRVKGLSKVGTVISADTKSASVIFGKATTKVPLASLRLSNEASAVAKSDVAVSKPQRLLDLRHEIDVRGNTGEEAWMTVDKYLDNCIFEGYSSATIIHGKGTGALRNAIWQHLRHDKRIASYRPGAYGEGDYGVTVVELKLK
ncbi:MAG TPA: endonuclease MutS2, partial [Bacillota bacterium]|nr:endonuclease MutS2 [Bacillota bacterium]